MLRIVKDNFEFDTSKLQKTLDHYKKEMLASKADLALILAKDLGLLILIAESVINSNRRLE